MGRGRDRVRQRRGKYSDRGKQRVSESETERDSYKILAECFWSHIQNYSYRYVIGPRVREGRGLRRGEGDKNEGRLLK